MISVCIATYNGERFIKEQLDSILSQLTGDDEIILSDDGSKDRTLDIVNAYHDHRIHVYRNEKHGYVHNFENALKRAKGDYIFLSDQDDIWFPEKVKCCTELLSNYVMVNHNSILTNGEGESLGVDFFSQHHSKGGYWQTLLRNSYSGCCMAFRRDVLDYALPFPGNVISHDIWLGLIAEKKGSCCFYSQPLIYYRRHGNNASSTSDKSKFSCWKQLKYRSYLLFYSFGR